MKKTHSNWCVTLMPGESRETRSNVIFTNLGRSVVKLAVQVPLPPASEGAPANDSESHD